MKKILSAFLIVFLASSYLSACWSTWGMREIEGMSPIIVTGEIIRIDRGPKGEKSYDTAHIRISTIHKNILADVKLKIGAEIPARMAGLNRLLYTSIDLRYKLGTKAVWYIFVRADALFYICSRPEQMQRIAKDGKVKLFPRAQILKMVSEDTGKITLKEWTDRIRKEQDRKREIKTLETLSDDDSLTAEPVKPLKALSKMKIKEITVFKDGHVFVLHSGRMPVDPSGRVVMDYLPTPVLGTYWPYSADKKAELRAVTVGKRKVLVEKTALSIREMIEANVGAKVIITERPVSQNSPAQFYEATIMEIPTRSSEELEALMPSASEEHLPQKGNVVMLRTDKGIKVIEFSRILDITFTDARKKKLATEEFRHLLTLDLKWRDKAHPKAKVGMIYLQKGIEWIPSYNIVINDKGKAKIKFEATLINELTDIDDVTAHLVVGIPSFAFQNSIDPIALHQSVAELSSSFKDDSETAYGLSQAKMLRSEDDRFSSRTSSQKMPLGPEFGGSQQHEDLYLFTVKHLSLRKGERMVIPIAEYNLAYEDVYLLDIPFSPPNEVLRSLGHSQRIDLIRTQGPKAKHNIRLVNKSKHPFTIAPVMIMKADRIVAQGMMNYTPVGGKVDIELTTAMDITVKKTDNEIKRVPNAVNLDGDQYTRINLEGKITLKNHKDEQVTVEITRYILGNIDTVNQKGENEMLNLLEDKSFLPRSPSRWWYNYHWPQWWQYLNGIGRIKWTTTLAPNKSVEHKYTWHYFSRWRW